MRVPRSRPAAVEDRWILSRLQRAREEIGERIDRFDFSRAALALYDFVYGELCDWYLELVKPRLRAGEADLAATLLHVLTETLTLAHPMIPFVTEEIYSHMPGAEGLLAARVAPERVAEIDDDAEARAGARDRGRAGRCAPGATAADVKVGAHGIGAAGRGGLRGDGRADRAAGPARVLRQRRRVRSRRSPSPVGRSRSSQSDALDLEAAERKRGGRAREARAEIERAERKLANEGSWPRPARRWSRPSGTSSRGCGGSSIRCELSRRPSATCCRSSCSACASAWTACAG